MLRILLIDDDTNLLESFTATLESLDSKVIKKCTSAKDGLDFMMKHAEDIDLIMCDWNMPEMTGLEMLLKVQELNDPRPFVMVTARRDVDSVLEAKDAGVTLYISKPFTRDEISKKLDWVRSKLKVK